MSQVINSSALPTTMNEKLRSIRRRQAILAVARAVAIGASVLIGAMLLAMVLDWWLTLFSTTVRTVLTVTSLGLAAVACLAAGVRPLLAAIGWKSAAASADEHVPELEERWTTVASFAVSEHQPTTSEGRAMLEQVTSEAVALGRLVKPQQVARPTAVRPAALTLAGCLLALAAFLALDWAQTSVLLRRFWSPTALITATQLRSVTGDVTIPRGESLDLVTEQSGLLRDAALLTLQYDSGTVDVFELPTDEDASNTFLYSLRTDDSFRYRVRAGDGQTDWRTVTVIDYPALAEVQFKVTAPDYIDRAPYEKTLIPGRVRVAQGSRLDLAMKPVADLERLELTLTLTGDDDEEINKTVALTSDADGWYRFESQLVEDVSLSPALFNAYGLTNEDRPVCRIHVIPDQAPVARVISPTDEMAVTADDVIDIRFEAHDDYGIATAELVVYDETPTEEGKEPQVLSVQPIPLGDQTLEKHVLANTQLDLKALNLQKGMNVSYAVRVTDNRQVDVSPDAMTAQRTEAKPGQTQDDQTLADASSPRDSEQTAKTSDEPGDRSDEQSNSLENALAAASDSARQTVEPGETDTSAPTESESPERAQNSQPGTAESNDDNPAAENPEAAAGERSDRDKPQADSDARPAFDQAGAPAEDGKRSPGAESPASKDRKNRDETAVAANRTPGDNNPTEPDGASPDEDHPADAVAQNPADAESASDADGNEGESQSGRPPLNVAARDGSEKDGARPALSTEDADSDDPQVAERSDSDAAGERSDTDGARPSNDTPNTDGSPEGETTLANADPQNPKDEADSDSEEDRGLSQSDGDRNADQNTDGQGNQSNDAQRQASNVESRSRSNDPMGDNADRPQSQPRPPLPFVFHAHSEGGQNAETSRRMLKITERLAALAAADEDDAPGENTAIRERVVAIDRMLAEVQAGLNRVVEREIPDADRGAQFGILDEQLGGVEAYIAELREETKEEQFEFVGLQMVDIGRTHVTPARDCVFVAIRDAIGADSQSADALQHVVRARELLAALLKRYDRVARERDLSKNLDEAITIYEVYVEKMQQLMREAQQNRNPLDRKMAVIEVDQDYLDRYAEVLTLRRRMLAEFAKMLADDPRLLAKYMDIVKRRGTSLRQQLTELAERQYDASTEVSGWLAASDDQRRDLWMLVAEMRLQAATPLARDAAELAERLDKQMPLVLDPEVGTAAQVLALGQNIARLAREITFGAEGVIQNSSVVDADSPLLADSERLVWTFGELDAALDRLNFENEQEQEVTSYVTGRLLESRTVADQADAWLRLARYVSGQQYHGLAEVDQEKIAVATELLRVDMFDMENDLAGQFRQLLDSDVPGEIVDMIRELHRIMEGITMNQEAATFALSQNRIDTAEVQQAAAMEGFDRAEELFDQVRRAVINALDEYDPPDPNIADLEDPTLDEFLANLEREPNIEAQLGIPNRPRNLRVIADSLLFDQEGDADIGSTGDAALRRAREAMRRQRNREKDDEEEQPQRPQTEEERQRQMDAKEMQEMIDKSLAAVEKQLDDPGTSAEERRRLEQMAENLRRMQGVNGQQPRQAWEQLAGSDEAKQILRALALGQPIPDQQWNHLMSTLDQGLWQVQGHTPPEDYRQAIEQYQERIRELVDTFGDDTE